MQIVLICLFISGLFGEINLPEIDDIEIKKEEKKKTAPSRKNDISIIIEVEGDPEEHKRYIETYEPSIKVVQVYDTLFYGLALKGKPESIGKIIDKQFVKGSYPVQTYTTLETSTYSLRNSPTDLLRANIFIPSDLNNTDYTGKGIKVGVVDTGIDFHHPDLISNYKGGYDLVDLDDDPMETTEEEGMPTSHGTHVAGIAAADGNMKGVASEADIYAYRALGPGGMGTSIQVMAAMEEAVKDGVDIMNLSLGNTVNGPDYPTSKAVNAAAKKGVAVVVANGNAGPNNWTVGAPATASDALSVGAYQPAGVEPYLYDPENEKSLKLSLLPFSVPWDLQRDYQLFSSEDDGDIRGKIGLIKQKNKPIAEDIARMQEEGAVAVLIYNIKPASEEWRVGLEEANIDIPLALVSTKDGRWLEQEVLKNENKFYKNIQEETEGTIARFSSRGPVTINWMMKPELIAPGVNILSTVPDGYNILNGTSMAAPHVAGAIAVIKEARPDWTNEQIFGALKTTANKVHAEDGELLDPIMQGAGLIDIAAAIHTETIITNPLLSFGKYGHHLDERVINVEIENTSEETQKFSFTVPKKERGLSWKLPQTFTINPGEKKEIPVELKVNKLELEQGTYQGSLKLHSGTKEYELPYLFISDTAEFPKVMGFAFNLNKFDKDKYEYQMYVTEPVKSIEVKLFDPHTLVPEGTLIKWKSLEVGMNEGEINRRKVEQRGHFYGLIVVQLENGEFINYETEVTLE